MSRKGENIYKRKDGRWEARYLKGHDPNGKALYGYCYARSYRTAKAKLLAACSVGGIPVKEKTLVCFAVYCDEWVQLKRSNVKFSTYAKYVTIVEKYIKPHIGNYRVSSITDVSVEQFGFDLMHKLGLSAKTARDILGVVRSILKYMGKQFPYLNNIEIIYPKTEKKEMRVLSQEEQRIFVSYLLKDMDLCKFGTLLALLTGLRVGELCAMRWHDVAMGDRLLYVGATMQRVCNVGSVRPKTKVIMSEPKTFSSTRIVPLTPFAIKLCRQFRSSPDTYILTGDISRYLEPRTMQRKIKQYTEACGLKGVHFHTLRHSFATRCVEVGFDIKSLSEILGHANPQITLARYVHSSLELKRENIKKLSALGY